MYGAGFAVGSMARVGASNAIRKSRIKVVSDKELIELGQ